MFDEMRVIMAERFNFLCGKLAGLEKSKARYEKFCRWMGWVPKLGWKFQSKKYKITDKIDLTCTILLDIQTAIQACDERNIQLFYTGCCWELGDRLWVCNHRMLLSWRSPELYRKIGELMPRLKIDPLDIGYQDVIRLSCRTMFFCAALDEVIPTYEDLDLPKGVIE